MTDREEIPTPEQLGYDWRILGNAQIASQYMQKDMQQGDSNLTQSKKALEMILKDANVTDPSIVNTMTDPNVIATALQNQQDLYNNYKGQQTVETLLEPHQTKIAEYLGETNYTHFQAQTEEIKNENYGEIIKKVDIAKKELEVIKAKGGSDEDKAPYQAIIKKYSPAITTINRMDSGLYAKFETRVEDAITKDVLNSVYASPAENSD